MRVKFTQTLSTAREVFKKGEEHTLPPEEARKAIAGGVAEFVPSDDQGAPPSTTAAATATITVDKSAVDAASSRRSSRGKS